MLYARKTHQFSHTVWSHLIGHHMHTSASTTISYRPAVLNPHAKLASGHLWGTCVTWWHSVMSQSQRIKGGTTDEAFEDQCFLWERGASFCLFGLFNFHMHKNMYKTWRKEWKGTIGLLYASIKRITEKWMKLIRIHHRVRVITWSILQF